MKTWTTRVGEEFLISNMETSHIRNCINYLENNPIAYGCYIDYDSMDYEEDSALTEAYIVSFRKELNKRGLNEKT